MSTSQTTPAPRPAIVTLVPLAGAAVAAAAMLWAAQPWRESSSSLDASTLAMVGFALLPHALIALALVFGRAVGWVWWTALAYGVLCSAVGILMDIDILTSDSSTAVLGFLFLPVYQLLGMIPAAVIGALVGAWSRRHRRGRRA